MMLRSGTRRNLARAPGLVVEVPESVLVTSSHSAPKRRASSPVYDPQSPATPHSHQQSKKIKLQSSYTTESPFPGHPHPTPAEALEVHNLLATTHRPNAPVVRRLPEHTSNSAQTCGNVPNVIEAIVGTILSQNTSGTNCTRAKRGLDEVFGRNNFEAIASAPKQKVVDAIRTGGLANKKAGMIQGLLKTVKEKHGVYSLQHLAEQATNKAPALRDEEIMAELLSYEGVGPKTASCVLLFCLGRDSFAVDTHVYRLSRLLGWVPTKADRVLAQAHLDIRIPADLKYGLHVLMIQHGRACKGCKRPGSGEGCVLKAYLRGKTTKMDEIDRKLEEVNREVEVEGGGNRLASLSMDQ